jgi:hypothetical protein
MSNETQIASRTSGDIYNDAAALDHSWRVAKLFASSQLVPKHLQEKPADCLIALALAHQLHESPLVVMQNIFIVSGKAGWSAQYMIGRANRAGVFKGRINWRIERRPKDLTFQRREKTGWDNNAKKPTYKETPATMPDLTVTAFATLADTGEVIEFSVTSQMAIAEGWADNVKYSSLAELMLRYRSAAFLIRLYAPDVMLGYQTVEEIETIPATERGEVFDLDLKVEQQTNPRDVRQALGITDTPANPETGPDLTELRERVADMEDALGDQAAELRARADLMSEAGLRAYQSALGAALDRALGGE